MVAIPLLWGMILTFAYYFAVHRGILASPLLARYTAGHWVEYAKWACSLSALQPWHAAGGWRSRSSWRCDAAQLPPLESEQLASQLATYDNYLTSLPESQQEGAYVRRLQSALSHVQRHSSAAQLEDELKYLADVEAERTHEGYSLVRMIIWATPMLGFLGTVIGITLAPGDLSPEALVNSPKEAMEGLLSGFSIAFDMMVLARTLSIFLMFTQFVTQQIESQLTSLVDRRVSEDLSPFFRSPQAIDDPQVVTLRQLASTMLESTDANSRRQAELWKTALDQAHRQWATLMQSAGSAVQAAVAGASRAAGT